MFVFQNIWRAVSLKHPFWDSPFWHITDEINLALFAKHLKFLDSLYKPCSVFIVDLEQEVVNMDT